MTNKHTRRALGVGAVALTLAITACGGSDGESGGGSDGGGSDGGLCSLVDTAALASAGGVADVDAVANASGCGFDGPGATSIAVTDRVLDIKLVEGDGATQFGATTDDLSLGVDGSALRENDDGWFSFEAVVGDQRLNVSNGVDGDGVYYESPELRTIAQEALTDWIATQQ